MADTPTVPSIQPKPKGLRLEPRTPHDSYAIRDRETRWGVLIICGTLTVIAPTLLGSIWGWFIGPTSTKIGFLAGLGGASVLTTLLVVRSLVSNPEWTGYVTLNPLNGYNIPYGPGLHPTFFWEQRNKTGNYSLKVITKTFEIPVQTKTSQVIATGILEYQIDLAHIANNVGIDETTVDAGYNGFIENFHTVRLARQTAEEALTRVDDINHDLENQFMGHATSPGGETVGDFEVKYGIRTVAIALTGLKLPSAVQKTRDAVDEARKIFEVMAELKGTTPEKLREEINSGRLSKQEESELRHAALAASENAELKIYEGNLGGLGALGDVISNGKKKN